jgi:hypothetical protein
MKKIYITLSQPEVLYNRRRRSVETIVILKRRNDSDKQWGDSPCVFLMRRANGKDTHPRDISAIDL